MLACILLSLVLRLKCVKPLSFFLLRDFQLVQVILLELLHLLQFLPLFIHEFYFILSLLCMFIFKELKLLLRRPVELLLAQKLRFVNHCRLNAFPVENVYLLLVHLLSNVNGFLPFQRSARTSFVEYDSRVRRNNKLVFCPFKFVLLALPRNLLFSLLVQPQQVFKFFFFTLSYNCQLLSFSTGLLDLFLHLVLQRCQILDSVLDSQLILQKGGPFISYAANTC